MGRGRLARPPPLEHGALSVVSRLPRVLGDLHILPGGPCHKLEGLLPRERADAIKTPPPSCLGQGREALGHEGWGGEGGGAGTDCPGQEGCALGCKATLVRGRSGLWVGELGV